jgi:uncharacterized membrane protein YkvA (DUF1232 family)
MSAQDRRRNAFAAFVDAFKPGSPGVGRRLGALPRMAWASIKGEYDGGKRLLLMAGAVLYVLSPLDALPELVLLWFGLIDDAFVIAWLLGALVSETDRFLEWEKSKGRGPSIVESDPIQS